MSFLTIPQTLTRYRLANARVPVCLVADAAQLKADADGLAPCDIVIEKERIATIAPAAPAKCGSTCAKGEASPGFRKGLNPGYDRAAVASTSILNSGRVKPETTTSVDAKASPAT